MKQRTVRGEHFFRGEHFGKNTFWGENTLGRTLLERRTLWGEHFQRAEHFEENTFFWLMKLHFDEGRTREPTVPLTNYEQKSKQYIHNTVAHSKALQHYFLDVLPVLSSSLYAAMANLVVIEAFSAKPSAT